MLTTYHRDHGELVRTLPTSADRQGNEAAASYAKWPLAERVVKASKHFPTTCDPIEKDKNAWDIFGPGPRPSEPLGPGNWALLSSIWMQWRLSYSSFVIYIVIFLLISLGTPQKFYCPRYSYLFTVYQCKRGTAVAQWLRFCATNRKVAGLIPAGVTGNFHWHKILLLTLWPWGRHKWVLGVFPGG
jgi:hypothetical protein